MPRKVIQLATLPTVIKNDYKGDDIPMEHRTLFALCEDGTIWGIIKHSH